MTSDFLDHDPHTRVSSGIEGFDRLLFGGFPKGRVYLIAGEPGTGKTIFGLQFLLEGAKRGETGVFISIDERPEHIIADVEALGWDIQPYLADGRIRILDITSYFSTHHVGAESEIDIERVITDVTRFVTESGASRVVVDPVAPIVFAQRNVPAVAEYIRRLIFSLEDAGTATTLMSSYVPVGSDAMSQHGVEEFAASGIILLRLIKIGNRYVRAVWVRKMRGTRIDLSEYTFEILPERGIVLRQPL